MNTSEANFFRWLIEERGYKPSDIKYNDSDTPDFSGKRKRWEVKKLYGNKIMLYSEKQAAYIEEGANGDFVVLMPKDPRSDNKPVMIIPCSKLKVNDRIHIKKLKKYNLRDRLISEAHPYPYLFVKAVFGRTGGDKFSVYIKDDKLIEWTQEKVKEGYFRSISHAFEWGLSLLKSRVDTPKPFSKEAKGADSNSS